jgi:hypothetical protein
MSAQAGTAIDDFGGLIDWARLNAWMAGRQLPGAGPVTAARKLAGGVQNNVFLLERGGESLVLRRPAKQLRPNSNETMLRETRILGALASSAVPHPTVYAVCDDSAVIGACFYLMSPLDGFAPSGPLPGRYATDPNRRPWDCWDSANRTTGTSDRWAAGARSSMAIAPCPTMMRGDCRTSMRSAAGCPIICRRIGALA